MRDLFLDLETYCDTPIKHGTYHYAERVEILLLSWAIDDAVPQVVDIANGEHLPRELQEAMSSSEFLVWFQNGDKFDWPVLERVWPNLAKTIPQERRRDTMVQAYSHSLPGNLEMMADALGVHEDKRKLKTGRDMIRLFCMPPPANVKRSRVTKATHPVEWEQFKDYAKQDIVTMRECHRRMPAWNYKGKQLDLWFLDQKINRRGMCMDVELAEAAVHASEISKKQLAIRTKDMTDGEVGSATQRDEMLRHILGTYGVSLPDMQKDTLTRRITDESLPEELRELMRVRLQSTTTSVAKFTTLLNGVNSDGRLRGCMQYRGAGRTGRVGHRLFQPGNMPRPSMKPEEIEWAIKLLKLDAAHLAYPNVMKVCSNTIRGTIIAPPGKKLVVADLANIEGRMAAWLAGEEWKLQAFRDYDKGIGPDLYIKSYASSFNVPVEGVPEKGSERQIGKVCLAQGSLILTQRGLVPIEKVTPGMRVWDGVDWVAHRGVVCNGIKEVITYDGLTATPDHKVWVYGTSEPIPFKQAATSGQHLLESGAGRLPIRIVDRDVAHPAVHPRVEWPVRTHAVPGMWSRTLDGLHELGEWSKHCLQRLWARAADTGMALAAAGASAAALHQPQSTRMASLRGAWCRIPVRLSDGSRVISDQQFRSTGSKNGGRSARQRWALRKGQPSVGHEAAKPAQYTTSKARVYDILNAGPRHRFTASGKLVSNCELMFQYGGGVGAWITGAATYGIDLNQMTEQVWGTLPEWAKNEAEGFLEWLCAEADEMYRREREKLVAKHEDLGREALNEELSHAAVKSEARKLKARHMLPERTFIACDAIKRLWRRAHPEISSYWKELENMIRAAIESPGQRFTARRLVIQRDGAWLRIRLPSGRALCYPSPAWDFVAPPRKYPGFSYMGLDQYTKRWQRLGSYGGKVFENVTQAAACDQLLECGIPVEEAGFEIVLSVHDEYVTEAPADRDDLSAARLGELMCSGLGWNQGLPLAAAGWSGARYRKE